MSNIISKYKKAINGKVFFVTGGTGSFEKNLSTLCSKNIIQKKLLSLVVMN